MQRVSMFSAMPVRSSLAALICLQWHTEVCSVAATAVPKAHITAHIWLRRMHQAHRMDLQSLLQPTFVPFRSVVRPFLRVVRLHLTTPSSPIHLRRAYFLFAVSGLSTPPVMSWYLTPGLWPTCFTFSMS